MVLTHGRRKAHKRNRGNEVGLKMSGSGHKIGQRMLSRRMVYRRTKSNLRRYLPRWLKIEEALTIMHKYFKENHPGQRLILVGKNETLVSDLGDTIKEVFNSTGYQKMCDGTGNYATQKSIYVPSTGKTITADSYDHAVHGASSFGTIDNLKAAGQHAADGVRHLNIIKHYHNGTDEFSALPSNIQKAVQIINDMKIKGDVGGKNVEHVIGTATMPDMKILVLGGYGVPVKLSPNSYPIMMFMKATCIANVVLEVKDIWSVGSPAWAALFTEEALCSLSFEAPPAMVICEIAATMYNLGTASWAAIKLINTARYKTVYAECKNIMTNHSLGYWLKWATHLDGNLIDAFKKAL
jgi:hypothetical protein